MKNNIIKSINIFNIKKLENIYKINIFFLIKKIYKRYKIVKLYFKNTYENKEKIIFNKGKKHIKIMDNNILNIVIQEFFFKKKIINIYN
ncbi:MAG: hypothetical protein ABPD24_00755 [Candidatus Shikimatogenerans sp. AspAUS03]|uniref:Uncharacterized protein n=1 Tax=Candidatus Shikimatogenerans sp. AspAUS03 TaxID=3158563 RepID=A0AAU7QU51_9FLAO